MNPGRLNKRIKIQSKASEKNEFGEFEDSWEDVKEVWAEVKPVTGRSFFAAQQINSEITHQVVIRYIGNIKPSMRVLYGTREFEILYCMNFDEANEAIQLMCKELIK